jgi:hypothetical protein
MGRASCGFAERSVTALVRRCPRFTVRLRTQHGPRELGHMAAGDAMLQARSACHRSQLQAEGRGGLIRRDPRNDLRTVPEDALGIA